MMGEAVKRLLRKGLEFDFTSTYPRSLRTNESNRDVTPPGPA
jgi:hypothetical protein